MSSGTRGLEDRSTSGSTSSTNHLSPLLRMRGFGGLFVTLRRSLTSSTSASCNRLRISANSKLLRTSTSSKSCDETYTSRSLVTRSTRDDSSGPNAATVQAPSRCHHTDGHERFNQAIRSHLLRYHVRVRSGFLIGCGGFGPSAASLANQAPVHCGCAAGTHGCDPVSTLRLDQPERQPCCCVVGSHVACCEVFVESWSFRTSVLVSPHFASGIFIAWSIGIHICTKV